MAEKAENMNNNKQKAESLLWSMEFTIPSHSVHLLKGMIEHVKRLFRVEIKFSNTFVRGEEKMQWIDLMGGSASADEMKSAKNYITSITNPEVCVSVENVSPVVYKSCVDDIEQNTCAYLSLNGTTVVMKGSELAVTLARSLLEEQEELAKKKLRTDQSQTAGASSASSYSTTNKPSSASSSSASSTTTNTSTSKTHTTIPITSTTNPTQMKHEKKLSFSNPLPYSPCSSSLSQFPTHNKNNSTSKSTSSTIPQSSKSKSTQRFSVSSSLSPTTISQTQSSSKFSTHNKNYNSTTSTTTISQSSSTEELKRGKGRRTKSPKSSKSLHGLSVSSLLTSVSTKQTQSPSTNKYVLPVIELNDDDVEAEEEDDEITLIKKAINSRSSCNSSNASTTNNNDNANNNSNMSISSELSESSVTTSTNKNKTNDKINNPPLTSLSFRSTSDQISCISSTSGSSSSNNLTTPKGAKSKTINKESSISNINSNTNNNSSSSGNTNNCSNSNINTSSSSASSSSNVNDDDSISPGKLDRLLEQKSAKKRAALAQQESLREIGLVSGFENVVVRQGLKYFDMDNIVVPKEFLNVLSAIKDKVLVDIYGEDDSDDNSDSSKSSKLKSKKKTKSGGVEKKSDNTNTSSSSSNNKKCSSNSNNKVSSSNNNKKGGSSNNKFSNKVSSSKSNNKVGGSSFSTESEEIVLDVEEASCDNNDDGDNGNSVIIIDSEPELEEEEEKDNSMEEGECSESVEEMDKDAIMISSDEELSVIGCTGNVKKKKKKKNKKNQGGENQPPVASWLASGPSSSSSSQSNNNRIAFSPSTFASSNQTQQPSTSSFASASSIPIPTAAMDFSHSNRKLRYIVIDGSNVAMAHGESKVYSVRGIQICINYFLARGHQVTAFVPESRRYSNNHIPIRCKALMETLNKDGHLKFTPARRLPTGKIIASYDDRFILNLAEMENGIVVSNDYYRDLINDKASYRNIIEKRLLPFMFVGDHFMPPDDPLGRDGPNLDLFLSHHTSSTSPAMGAGASTSASVITGVKRSQADWYLLQQSAATTAVHLPTTHQHHTAVQAQTRIQQQLQGQRSGSWPVLAATAKSTGVQQQQSSSTISTDSVPFPGKGNLAVSRPGAKNCRSLQQVQEQQKDEEKVKILSAKLKDSSWQEVTTRNNNTTRTREARLRYYNHTDINENGGGEKGDYNRYEEGERNIGGGATAVNESNSRSPVLTEELFGQLSEMFDQPEQQHKVRTVLNNHPNETDLMRLSNYVINALTL